MAISHEEAQRLRELDRRAVVVGTIVTVVATLLSFVLPELLYEGSSGGAGLDARNPYLVLQVTGGLVGGSVAGWLTSELGSGMETGLKAALYGLGIVYVIGLAAISASTVLFDRVGPDELLTAGSFYTIYVLAIFIPFLLGGLFAGAAANRVSRVVVGRG